MPYSSNVIVLLYDGSTSGKDATANDIYDIQDGIKADGTLRSPYLPPAAPFCVARIWGVTKEQIRFLMDVGYSGQSIQYKRVWQLRTQNVAANVRNYYASHRFVGFGAAADNPYPNGSSSTVNSGDFEIWWGSAAAPGPNVIENAATWMYNKQTRQTADQVPI